MHFCYSNKQQEQINKSSVHVVLNPFPPLSDPAGATHPSSNEIVE